MDSSRSSAAPNTTSNGNDRRSASPIPTNGQIEEEPWAEVYFEKRNKPKVRELIARFEDTGLCHDSASQAGSGKEGSPPIRPLARASTAHGVQRVAKDIEERMQRQKQIASWKPPKNLLGNKFHRGASGMLSSVGQGLASIGSMLPRARTFQLGSPRDESDLPLGYYDTKAMLAAKNCPIPKMAHGDVWNAGEEDKDAPYPEVKGKPADHSDQQDDKADDWVDLQQKPGSQEEEQTESSDQRPKEDWVNLQAGST